jgi:mitochondrial import receptor subunit TOM40
MFKRLIPGCTKCETMPSTREDKQIFPPVLFENFCKEWQQLCSQDTFDGFRIEVGKNVTKQLQISHSLILATSLRENGYLYQFGSTFQSLSGNSFATARASPDGTVNLRLGTKLSNAADLKVSIGSNLKDTQRNSLEGELSWLGSSYASSIKLVHQGTWIVNGSFSREVSDNLFLGTDFTYIPLNGVSIVNYGARYVTGPHVVSTSVGQQPDFRGKSPADTLSNLKIQYLKKVSDRLSLGAEIEGSFPDKESSLKLGYEYTFRQARVQGLLDSSGKVQCFISDMMGFGVSGLIDYVKGDYKFGFMMHIVPQPDVAA